MKSDEILHLVDEAMRAATPGIGDPCAEAEETVKTARAKQEYDKNILNNGDAIAGQDALDKAGNLLSTKFHKIRYAAGEFIGDKVKAAETRTAAPITPEILTLRDFLAKRGKSPTELGFDAQGRITDKAALMASPEFKEYTGNTSYRIKEFRKERTSSVRQEITDALRSDKFTRLFDDKNEFGRIITKERFDQIHDPKLKVLVKNYNRAVRAHMVDRAARKLAYAPSPKEAAEKYIEDGANELRSTLGILHKTWNDALNTLPEKSNKISQEMNLDIIKELSGERSGNDQASRFAHVIMNKLYPLKRELLADAGINYDARANYLPTMHDQLKIAHDREQWIGDTMHYLDLGLMDLDDNAARSYLERVWQGFDERAGRTDIDKTASGGSTSIAQQRKLIFKDAESYLEYHKKYGKKFNIKHILSDFIDETAHQVVSARRYADADGMHTFNDLLKGQMQEKQNIGYAARFAVGSGDEGLVDKLKTSKSELNNSSLFSNKDLSASEMLDSLAHTDVIDKKFLDTIRNATSENEVQSAVAPFTKDFQEFLRFAERKMSGDLPMHSRTLGDKTYNWISAGARGTLYAWMAVKGLIWDTGQRALAESQTKDIAAALKEVVRLGTRDKDQLNAIGMVTRTQMHDLELKSRAFADDAVRNKFEAQLMRTNLSEIYAESTQSATRMSLLHGISQNLDVAYDDLPAELKDGISKKAWEVFRQIDERGDDTLLDDDLSMNIKNPAKILNGAGFTDEERSAAHQIQSFIDDRAARTSQLADETTRIQRARVNTQYADSTIERAIHSSIFGVSNVMKAFSRKTAPLMINLLRQGRYGSVAGLVVFSTMLGALNKIVSLLLEGKNPNAEYFADPEFWLDSMSMGGLVTNWAVTTALQVHDTQSFGKAVASTMYGSGLEASYDLYQMSASLLTGDTKGFRKYASTILSNDFSVKRIPVAGLVADRLIMDPIINALDPGVAAARQRSIRRAAKLNTPYYWK